MGLAATIRGAVDTVFGAVGDLSETATYARQTGGMYDVATGTSTPTEALTELSVLITVYSARERQDIQIRAEDRRAIIQGSALSTAPKVGDRIVRASGEAWDVIAVAQIGTHDDAELAAGWDLQLRRPS